MFGNLDDYKVYILAGRGDWAAYYTSPPKFYDNVFLIVGFTTLGTFIYWLVY